jgi:hypothetical protein
MRSRKTGEELRDITLEARGGDKGRKIIYNLVEQSARQVGVNYFAITWSSSLDAFNRN